MVLAVFSVKIWHVGGADQNWLSKGNTLPHIISSGISHVLLVLTPRLGVLWGHDSAQGMCGVLQEGSQTEETSLWHHWSYQERASKLTDYDIRLPLSR